MAGHNSLELEIHNLFQEGNNLDTICDEVLSKFEKNDVISPLEAESVSHFLLTAGRIDLLFKFYSKCLRKKSLGIFPWGNFVEAVKQIEPELSENLIDLIELGLAANPDEASSLKSETLLYLIPTLQGKVQSSKKNFELEKLQLKTKLMAQLNHNRLYQLAEQEEQTLIQLIKIFPMDIDVKLLHQAHLEKKADEILARVKNPNQRSASTSRRHLVEDEPEARIFINKLDRVITELAHKLKSQSPDQIYNLALLAMHFELFDLSLKLIEIAPQTNATEWLKAEMLFESGRHLELLKHIEKIENQPALNSDTTYGAIYLKAQAYQGLGQKEIAIRLLESLSDKVPHYRSIQALLHEWKTI